MELFDLTADTIGHRLGCCATRLGINAQQKSVGPRYFESADILGNMVLVLGLECMGLPDLTGTYWTPFLDDAQPDL